MVRTQLNDTQRLELQHLRRRTDVPPPVRDRVEMVMLSDAGWSPPRMARHLDYCAHTVRSVLHAYAQRGVPALWPQRRGPAPNLARRQQVGDALRALLEQQRTWTVRQLVAALADHGIALRARQIYRYLHHVGARYRRTGDSLHHHQDPTRVIPARATLASLEKKRRPGGSSSGISTKAASHRRCRPRPVGPCRADGC